jgi:hypothetical protein
MQESDYSASELIAAALAISAEVMRLLEHNGQYCTCEEYRPCPHPPEQQGTNDTGRRYCRQCAQHFKDTDIYRQAVANILGIPVDQVTDKLRAFAKEVSFGARYGFVPAGGSPTGRKKL